VAVVGERKPTVYDWWLLVLGWLEDAGMVLAGWVGVLLLALGLVTLEAVVMPVWVERGSENF
jgi:hypothetical protein